MLRTLLATIVIAAVSALATARNPATNVAVP
jgi:hypothetical protein